MNPPYGSEIGKWVEKAATGGAAKVKVSSRRMTAIRPLMDWWIGIHKS